MNEIKEKRKKKNGCGKVYRDFLPGLLTTNVKTKN